jgi:hypothetical protein
MKKEQNAVAVTKPAKSKLTRADIINVMVELDGRRNADRRKAMALELEAVEAELSAAIHSMVMKSLKSRTYTVDIGYDECTLQYTVGEKETGFPTQLLRRHSALDREVSSRDSWDPQRARARITKQLEDERLQSIMSEKEIVADIETVFAKLCS